MYKLQENIGYTNPPPSLIPNDNYSFVDNSLSVSRGYVRIKNNVEWVWRNPIHPQFIQDNNSHHNTNNTQQKIILPEGDTVNKLKEPYFKIKRWENIP